MFIHDNVHKVVDKSVRNIAVRPGERHISLLRHMILEIN